MNYCHKSECSHQATRHVEVESQDGEHDLAGFTIPACEEHAPAIKVVVEHICGEAEVSVRIVPPGGSEHPLAVPDE